jgi:hypothetical protein
LPPLLLRFRTDRRSCTRRPVPDPRDHHLICALQVASATRARVSRSSPAVAGEEARGKEARGDVGGGGEEAVEMGEVTIFPENEQRERCKRKMKMPLQHPLDLLQWEFVLYFEDSDPFAASVGVSLIHYEERMWWRPFALWTCVCHLLTMQSRPQYNSTYQKCTVL